MISVQKEDIDIKQMIEKIRDPENGCIVSFLGTVRDHAKGQRVVKMEIEVYEDMACKQLSEIRSEAVEKYGVNEVFVIHRYGELDVEDNIVFIAVSSGHRDEAFQACMYVIDELKKRVPIWKKETTTEGDYWVEGEKHE